MMCRSQFSFGIVAAWFLMSAALIQSDQGNAAIDTVIDGVPIPNDASPIAVTQSSSPFAGTWVGTWGGVLKSILIVESIASDGSVSVVYAIGDNPLRKVKRAWFRYDGEIAGDKMKVFGKDFVITYKLTRNGRLQATFGEGFGFGIMSQQNLPTISKPNTEIKWTTGSSQLLATDLTENGKGVKLDVVIFTPKGNGPFPLAVVNHGSTGRGSDQSIFTDTWTNEWLAELLNKQGWIVAFPQRRGRGKSNGKYDEGFAQNRSEGYTCETERSLAGADRALQDIGAVISALHRRNDVNDEPILLVGNSRGGILSAAYAGLYPKQVKGVINFVGGWMGDGCTTATKINQTLFKKAGKFKQPMLWLYGNNDYYYSMSHSRQNFDTFKAAGGSGTFYDVNVPGTNNGHWVLSVPTLWSGFVLDYLRSNP